MDGRQRVLLCVNSNIYQIITPTDYNNWV